MPTTACETDAMLRPLLALALFLSVGCSTAGELGAQVPVEGEVRQLVTFSFLPGKSAEATAVFRDQAVPLYRQDEAMLTFRAFREVESPVPLDLIVVSSFRGMSGMDASNVALRELATAAGTSIGAVYGQIGGLSSSHTDQFVEMIPSLGRGDPTASRLTALIWYRVLPGQRAAFETALGESVADGGGVAVSSATGRFLLSDGWDYLRFVGFDSLGQYQEYWDEVSGRPSQARIDTLVSAHRQVILAGVPSLAVR
jgi:hypothetical protein